MERRKLDGLQNTLTYIIYLILNDLHGLPLNGIPKSRQLILRRENFRGGSRRTWAEMAGFCCKGWIAPNHCGNCLPVCHRLGQTTQWARTRLQCIKTTIQIPLPTAPAERGRNSSYTFVTSMATPSGKFR